MKSEHTMNRIKRQIGYILHISLCIISTRHIVTGKKKQNRIKHNFFQLARSSIRSLHNKFPSIYFYVLLSFLYYADNRFLRIFSSPFFCGKIMRISCKSVVWENVLHAKEGMSIHWLMFEESFMAHFLGLDGFRWIFFFLIVSNATENE